MSQPPVRRCARTLIIGIVALLLAPPADAAVQEQVPAIRGTTTAQDGTVLLPGVAIVVSDARQQTVASAFSDGAGQFQVLDVPPGTYQLRAALDGFAPIERTITVQPEEPLQLDLEFDLAQVVETVQVVIPVTVEFTDITVSVASREVFGTAFIEESPTPDDSIESALPLLPGVIRGPDGINIKGGRPTQSSLQLGGVNVTDPSTGNADFTVPSSGVASVEVLPNPYSVEFGRFTSGVTVIEPKRGGDTWEVAINNPVPAFHTNRDQPLKLTGIRGFSPSLTVAGPVIPGRLFLAQSAQYRYSSNDVRSRPQNERRTQESLNMFTRLGTILPGGHRLGATIGIFPESLGAVGLDTFNPPGVTPNVRRDTYHFAVTDSAALSTLALLESTLQIGHHREEIRGRGTGDMELFPEENSGSYFNEQVRRSTAYQWLGSWSGFHGSGIGDNLFKVGADVLHVRFDGESQSVPVNIRRLDGTLARRIGFGDSPRHALNTTDVAFFAQDRWQLHDRLLLEFGVRFDHDGVLDRSHVTPRVGTALKLNREGTMAVRGGIGLFYERTPSTAGVFDQFEPQIVTDFGADGTSPLGLPTLFNPTRAENLDTARSRTWHLEYQHRLTPSLTLAVEHLRRVGTRELIVERTPDSPAAQLLLSSQGESRYRETGVEVEYSGGESLGFTVAYVHSDSAADLNAFAAFFNSVRTPLIRANEFAPTDANAPHRLVARARVVVNEKWRFVPLLELRNGFPYTAVDERLDFVGPRNRGRRFPTVARFDIAAERQVTLGQWRPWLGVRVLNLFNRLEPRDVQNVLESPRFGQFFNSDPLRLRVTVRVQL